MDMQSLKFFDGSCSFGFRKVLNPGSFYTLEDLLGKMKYYGIQKALVYHNMAREYDLMYGNNRLLYEIDPFPGLIPVWIVMPHHTGEFPEPLELKQLMKEKGINAVRMFPTAAEHNFSIAKWSCGELFSMLEESKIPLFIGLDQTDWNGVNDLCSSYPEMRIILTDVNYRIDRYIYPLLKQHKNLYIETFGYKNHNGIEELCSKFGAGRLIFGSGMPVYSGGSAIATIIYARISDDEKRSIAGENLEKLLGGVQL